MRRIQSVVSWLLVVAVMVICAPVSKSFAAVNNDEVTSVKLKEADGTSGQNTNSGSGVKTGHIQNGAVIDAKISGQIATSKLSTYANTYVIHKGPANNVTTFNSLMACINYLTNNTANWTGERVAIKLMPGRYTGEDFSALGTSTINADIIGTSKESTIIAPLGRSMHLPSGMNLRNVTIDGVYVNIDHTVNSGIYDSKVIASPTEDYYAAIEAGWQTISNFTMDNVEILAWAGSIGLNGTNSNDTLTLKNIKVVAMIPGAGHVTILYPGSNLPIKFSNVSFTGPGSTAFNFVLCNNTNFILENINVASEYTTAFSGYGSSNMRVKVSNSNLNTPTLIASDSVDNVETTIDNSYIGSVSGIVGSVKISNSKINGAIPPSNGLLKIVNSFDTNYDVIPNGQY